MTMTMAGGVGGGPGTWNIYNIETMTDNFSFSLYLSVYVGNEDEDSFLPLGASGSPQLGGFKLGSSAEVFSAKVPGGKPGSSS